MAKVTGRAKGGMARAEALSAKERSAIARNAAAKRWDNSILKATHGDPTRPLRIGDFEIPCYVLSDGTRVLSQGGMIATLGMARGGAGNGRGDRLGSFAVGKGISPFISQELMAVINSPIEFKPPHGGTAAMGYPATILADICDAVLAARAAGALQQQQSHIADRCEILVRGFARVGIIALVDEATGYQKDRARDALSKILEAFVAKELQPWVKTFPTDFYEHMFRLRSLPYPNETVKKPQYFGHLTNDIIYRRLAPGVLAELKRAAEKSEADGARKGTLHQRLTPDTGHPKLRELLASVTTIMKLSKDWHDFKEKLDQIHSAYNETIPLPFIGGLDDGRGI